MASACKIGTGRINRDPIDSTVGPWAQNHMVRVYVALNERECGTCHTRIGRGDYFTRGTPNGQRGRLTLCAHCQPFTPITWLELMS